MAEAVAYVVEIVSDAEIERKLAAIARKRQAEAPRHDDIEKLKMIGIQWQRQADFWDRLVQNGFEIQRRNGEKEWCIGEIMKHNEYEVDCANIARHIDKAIEAIQHHIEVRHLTFDEITKRVNGGIV